jgi:hypothetical protein
MFELVKALNDGAEALKASTSNPISLNAGCELFIAFVTLLPHDSAVSTVHLPYVTLLSQPDYHKELLRFETRAC